MPTYHFTGSVTLEGVNFYIDAYTIEEARSRARNGDFCWKDSGSGIEFVDIDVSTINLSTVEAGALEND